MNIGRAHPRPTGEDGAYDRTRYVSIVELEICQLRRCLEETNQWNAELEREAVVARAAQENNTQNQPDPGVRRPRGRPRGSQTRRQKTAQENPQNAQEEQPRKTEGPPENEQPGKLRVPPENEQPNDRPKPSHRNDKRRRPETREQEIPRGNKRNPGTQPRARGSPMRHRQRSSQKNRQGARTNPTGGHTTNHSEGRRMGCEEASITSRSTRTHNSSMRGGESTRLNNDRESTCTSKTASQSRTTSVNRMRSMSRTKSVSRTKSASNYNKTGFARTLELEKT
ncbi:uncharacterized protein LOC133036219 [Cannabis sativa]|uniref:uncharacterized protein LOC133036219 n=1 Tax=Cannabis sativa TaxID=3483 RepID=UPI0029CA428F|nr:uncharacterized protein LOC133036219 [Cannabis sativa]